MQHHEQPLQPACACLLLILIFCGPTLGFPTPAPQPDAGPDAGPEAAADPQYLDYGPGHRKGFLPGTGFGGPLQLGRISTGLGPTGIGPISTGIGPGPPGIGLGHPGIGPTRTRPGHSPHDLENYGFPFGSERSLHHGRPQHPVLHGYPGGSHGSHNGRYGYSRYAGYYPYTSYDHTPYNYKGYSAISDHALQFRSRFKHPRYHGRHHHLSPHNHHHFPHARPYSLH
ncbi:hypothetical protein FHG87_002395 [Trinorchestia longiramus]|nr:hypothetical protein FHG87_002395 [Trinorchestia longiramus]